MKQSLALLQWDYRRARRTDKELSYGVHLFWLILTGSVLWLPVYTVLLFVLPALSIITESVGYLIGSYLLGLFLNGIWWHVLSFKLIDRHVKHIERKGKLFEDMVDFVKESAAMEDSEKELGKNIYSLELISAEYFKYFPKRLAGTWTLIGIFSLGVSTYYAAFFMMNELRKMQQVEDDFLQILSEILGSLGIINYPITYEPVVPQREYGIFAAISVATLGLYWFYWWYVLITDHNRFFVSSERWESALIFTLFHRDNRSFYK